MPTRRSIFNPTHFRVIRLHLEGQTQADIARITGLAPTTVNLILHSPEATEIMDHVKGKYLDTMLDVQVQAQLVAPEMLAEKIHLALHSKDERVRSVNTKDILEIAGHKPDTRVILQRQEDAVQGEFATDSPEELRKKLLEALVANPAIH